MFDGLCMGFIILYGFCMGVVMFCMVSDLVGMV